MSDKFKARYTRYEIPINENDFERLLDEGLWNIDSDDNEGETLSEILDKLEGVFNTDYDGFFGHVVLLSIEGKYNTSEKKMEILNIIQKYVNYEESS